MKTGSHIKKEHLHETSGLEKEKAQVASIWWQQMYQKFNIDNGFPSHVNTAFSKGIVLINLEDMSKVHEA